MYYIGMIEEEDPTCKMSHVLVGSSLVADDMHFSCGYCAEQPVTWNLSEN